MLLKYGTGDFVESFILRFKKNPKTTNNPSAPALKKSPNPQQPHCQNHGLNFPAVLIVTLAEN